MELKKESEIWAKHENKSLLVACRPSNMWISEKDLLVCIEKLKDRFFLTMIDGSQETNKTDTFDAHTYINEELIEKLSKR